MSEVTFAKSFLATLDKRPIKLPADHVSDPRQYPSQSPYILPRQTHPFPRKGPRSGDSTTASKSQNVTATLKPMRAGAGDATSIPDLTLETTLHEIKTRYAQLSGLAVEKVKVLYNKKPAGDLKTLREVLVGSGAKDVASIGNVELSVMIMGGAAGTGSTTSSQPGSPAVSSSTTEKNQSAAGLGGASAAATTTTTTTTAATAGKGDPMDVDKDTPGPDSEKAQAEAGEKLEAHTSTVTEILGSDEFWADLKGFLAQRLRDEEEGERLAKRFRGNMK
ncbi:hypothetical protein KC340_g4444 [Hortaea werneckii]|nr:hypothetical protein KC340_g4444 [Hortaea werneckii]KAI7406091.1 hypothetical protein KC328_g1136 [Hortaea werneckii]